MLNSLFTRLTRKKHITDDHMQTNLKRCLTTFDITLLGIGHMMGSGIYVLSPAVAKGIAGPALIISYLIAGVASLLAALAYAEFGVRFPRAGSAYSYSYFSVGEFWAFFVGWNVLLENVIGISAVARACSSYIDSLTGGIIKETIQNATGTMPGPYLSAHPDFLALVIIILYVAFMSVGVQATSWLNNVLCIINIVVLIVIIIVGACYADFNNWTSEETHGFMPFGFHGVLAASASCFFAYVGFDAIAASGEEAKDPQKSLPIATLISMAIVTVLYIAVSAVLTLMINYTLIIPDSGLPDALAYNGAIWAKYVVIVGALCGMSTVLIGTLYALTRIAYAMAEDGLIHKVFGVVNHKSQIPLVAMYVFSALAGVLAVILDIETLVEMMSIGTLFAYLIVSGGVIIFRYRPNTILKTAHELKPIGQTNGHFDQPAVMYSTTNQHLRPNFQWFQKFFPANANQQTVVSWCVVVIISCTYFLGFFVQYNPQRGEWWAILLAVAAGLAMFICFWIIFAHEQCKEAQKYKMPFVPLLPVASIVINAALMTTLQPLTWLRLLVWVVIGLTGYFVYGLQHSKLN